MWRRPRFDSSEGQNVFFFRCLFVFICLLRGESKGADGWLLSIAPMPPFDIPTKVQSCLLIVFKYSNGRKYWPFGLVPDRLQFYSSLCSIVVEETKA